MHRYPVALSVGTIIAQGELAVGAATVALSATSVPCKRVWFGAPTAANTVGAVNDEAVLIGGSATANLSGGRVLAKTDSAGFEIEIDDANKVYLTGLAAGDVVEYQILG